ncbi:uncharacterized protein [Diabrotica undecimpunctata]|uniref:uncharacterized protein n=1 Tax=Diabrotica undecimpunctata TaxID=50387 RepID=UPI003B63D231
MQFVFSCCLLITLHIFSWQIVNEFEDSFRNSGDEDKGLDDITQTCTSGNRQASSSTCGHDIQSVSKDKWQTVNEFEDPFHNSDDEDKDPDYIPEFDKSNLDISMNNLDNNVAGQKKIELTTPQGTSDANGDTGESSPAVNIKRTRNIVQTVPSKRSRIVRATRKICRNTGQLYVTESGKEVWGKFCHNLLPCQLNCSIRFINDKSCFLVFGL